MLIVLGMASGEKGAFVSMFSHMRKQANQNTHADKYMYLCMLQTLMQYSMRSHLWELPDKAMQNTFACPIITFCIFFYRCLYLKGEYRCFYIPTNPPNPFSLGPFSSYLLPSSFFKQFVSPMLSISICVHFASSPLSFVFLVLFFSPTSPRSLHLFPLLSVCKLYFQL